MTNKLVALMPMRHNSERVKGKNYRPFGDGRPLFQHMLDTLLSVNGIDKVVIDTDSPTIKDILKDKYKDVVLIERPEHLCAGEISMNEIIKYDMVQAPSEFYFQTHATNPLLSKESVQKVVDTFFDNYPNFDSVFTVTRFQSRLWDPLARAVNHNRDILLRTQDLPPLYEENSCGYLFSGEHMLKTNNRIGQRPYLLEIPVGEARDIDEEIDFTIAEIMYKSIHGIS